MGPSIRPVAALEYFHFKKASMSLVWAPFASDANGVGIKYSCIKKGDKDVLQSALLLPG